jgi:hypothetical protein
LPIVRPPSRSGCPARAPPPPDEVAATGYGAELAEERQAEQRNGATTAATSNATEAPPEGVAVSVAVSTRIGGGDDWKHDAGDDDRRAGAYTSEVHVTLPLRGFAAVVPLFAIRDRLHALG